MAATYEQKQEMVRRYAAGEGPTAIAKEFGVAVSNVVYHARKSGVCPQMMRRYPKEKACAECGERFLAPVDNAGKLYCSSTCRSIGAGKNIATAKFNNAPSTSGKYITVYIPEDSISRTSHRKRVDRVAEHVFVAEKALGRPLQKGEVVHHINCDQRDNRNANLLICTRSYHAWLHGEMSRRWAAEHFSGGLN